MDESKHTKGPWRVARIVDSKFPKPHTVYVLIDDGRKRNVCAVSVYGRDENGKPTKTRQELGEQRPAPSITDKECEANAKLIAAAPDLLEACIFALSVQKSNVPWDLSEKMNVERLEAAIAKARGE